MKRMSDVFDLPVFLSHSEDFKLLDDFGRKVAEFRKIEQAELCYKAINHVDALADALDELLKQVAKVYSDSKPLGLAEDMANDALKSYRGEK